MLETKNFRVWLVVVPLLCLTFLGELCAAQEQAETPAYRIAAGDTVQIAVWMEPEYTKVVRVNGEGNIHLPFARDLKVSGLTAADLTNLLYDKLKPTVPNLQVTVRVTPRLYKPSAPLLPGARPPHVRPNVPEPELKQKCCVS